MDIKEKQELSLSNILSVRIKGDASEIQTAVEKVNDFVKNGGFKLPSISISTTHGMEIIGNRQIFDFEVLIPMEGDFDPPAGGQIKEKFLLTNAVCLYYEGKQSGLEEYGKKLAQYIEENRLQPITPGYNVRIRDPEQGVDTEDTDPYIRMNIYVGISPNFL